MMDKKGYGGDSGTAKTTVDISVVLPAMNEEQNIRPMYLEFRDVLAAITSRYEIIFIDDGSIDGTFREIMTLHENDPRVKCIQFRRNFGQTAALDAGFKMARGTIIVSMDCDLQDDPHELPRLLEQYRKGYDVVCAWRQKRSDKLGKKISSRLAFAVRRMILHDDVHDSGCQFRVYSNACVKDLELSGELHRFIPALCRFRGYKVTEVPVHHRQRKFGKTKYRLSRVFKGLADILLVKFWELHANRPVYFFGKLGLGSFGLGFLTGLYLLYEKFYNGMALANRPMLTLAVLLIIIGVQLGLIGLLADVLVRTYHRAGHKSPYTVKRVVD